MTVSEEFHMDIRYIRVLYECVIGVSYGYTVYRSIILMCHTRSRSRTRHILKHRITLIGTKNSYLFVLPVDVKLPYIDYKLFSTRYTLQGLFKFARTQIIDYTHIQEHIYIYIEEY